MSYDRLLSWVCPHQVVNEALYFNDDLQIIRPLRPVANLGSLAITVNGLIAAPSTGVTTPAQTIGSKQGPFNIVTGVSDIFSIRVNQGAIQTLVLHSATQIQPQLLANLLNAGLQGVFFSVSGNQIAMQSTTSGPASSIFVLSTSTLGGVLGITTNREYRGKQILPGWTLVFDPNTLSATTQPARMIVFDEPLLASNSFVQLSYSTVRNDCRRCAGSGVENDWRYGGNGEVAQVINEDLLLQEIEKIMFTLRGTNPFHEWYGTGLIDSIGKKISLGGFVQNFILSEITDAFNRWQSIKNQQEQKLGQEVTDREFPYRLLNASVQQSTSDPTVIFVNMTIQNRSNQPIQLEKGLKLPQPLDLLGTNQQQALLLASLNNWVSPDGSQ